MMTLRRLMLLSLLGLLLAGCADGPQAGGSAAAEPVPAARTAGDAADDDDGRSVVAGTDTAGSDEASATAMDVDYSCKVDSDCEVKNVGNCCGYYPACVNVDSPTFPDLVRARCEAEGMMSICGFPEISGCQCVEGRCSNITGPGPGAAELR
jgi:hypothetical protein